MAEGAGGAPIEDLSSAEVITPPEGGGLRSHEFFESFKMLNCEIKGFILHCVCGTNKKV